MSQLTQNTTDLDALIAKANALPDAGSGGGSGGGAVETCTVEITADNGKILNYMAITYTDGNYETVYEMTSGVDTNAPFVLSNVVCGTSVYIQSSYALGGFTCTNCEMTRIEASVAMVRITAGKDSVATIHCYDND